MLLKIMFIIFILIFAFGIYNIEGYTNYETVTADRLRMSNPLTFPTGNTYYCNYNGTCQANGCAWCGINTLDRLPTRAYGSLAECENRTQPYSKLGRYECLKGFGRGWCTDNNGDGQCLVGTPEAPKYRRKYDWCNINGVSDVNNWTYGFDAKAVFNPDTAYF